MHALISLLLYSSLFLLSLRVVLPPLLHLLLLPPSLRLSHLTPTSLVGLSFAHRTGVRIEVARVRLARPRGEERRRGAWVALRFEGVLVRVPSSFLSSPPPPPPSPPTAPPRPPTPPRRPPALLARFAPLVRRLALSIDLRIELEGACALSCSLAAGASLSPAQGSAWVRLSGVELRGQDDADAAAAAAAAAVVMRGGAELRVEAPLSEGWVPRAGGVRVVLAPVGAALPQGSKGEVREGEGEGACRGGANPEGADGEGEGADGEGEHGVHVRVPALQALLRCVGAQLAARAPVLEKKKAEKAQGKGDRAWLRLLGGVDVSLPPVLLSAHYTSPSPSAGPQAMAFALTLRGGRVRLREGDVGKEHAPWVAKGERVWSVGMEWREVEGRVSVDGSEDDSLHDAAKALSLGPSRLDLSSTFLPPSLSPPAPARKDYAPPDHNDALVVVEGFLGPVRGHAAFETLDAALRIIAARPRAPPCPSRAAASPSPSPSPAAAPSSSKRLYALPRLAGALVCAGIELRLTGPRASSSLSLDPPDALSGDPDDPFFGSWCAPELLCLSAPGGQVSFEGGWEERSVRRSEVERRAAERARRHHRGKGKERERERERSRSRSRAREEPEREERAAEGGDVPPPRPLSEDYSRRRVKPLRVAPNRTKDLDKFSYEYALRVSASADTVNVYILASNHDAHAASERGYDSDSSSSSTSSALPALPSDPVRLDILALGPLELTSAVRALGDEELRAGVPVPFVDLKTCRGEHGVLLETIEIDLWRPVVMGCVRDIVSALAIASTASSSRAEMPSSSSSSSDAAPAPPVLPLVDLLPADQHLYLALASFDLRVAGTDPKADAHSCRGVALHSGPFVLQYVLASAHDAGLTGDYAVRGLLDLTEDLRVEANAAALAAGGAGARVALAKLSLLDWSVDPVVDARASRGRKRGARRGDGLGESDGEEDWELRGRAELSDLTGRRRSIIPPRYDEGSARSKEEREAGRGLVVVPHIALRLTIERAPEHDAEADATAPLDMIKLTVFSKVVTARVELFSIYLCLVAISSLRSLLPKAVLTPDTAAKVAAARAAKPHRPPPVVHASGEITDLHLFPTLPHDTHLFLNFRRFTFQHDKAAGLAVEWEKAILAGQSPTVPGKWDDIISLRGCEFRLRPDATSANNGHAPFVVALSSETARLRIPFRYIFSRIVDNAVSLAKATKQLVYEHVQGGRRVIIEPGPEDPKRLPQVELRVGLFAVEMQDDPFETKLNIIWRAGYEEQLARLERQKAFEAKVEAIRRAESSGDRAADDEGSDATTMDDDEDEGAFPSRSKPKVGARHTIGIDEAQHDLLKYNSSHWIKRIRNASAEQARREEALTRRLYGVADRNLQANARLPIELVPVSKSAPLARGTFHGVSLVVAKPSFGDEGLGDFLHDVGKGLPRDTVFSLIIPLHLSWKMHEARFQLRDYPLPLLHVPRSGHPDVPSWSCEMDLVVAEEVSGPEAVRRVPCAVIPQHVFEGQGAPYTIVVPRSAMPVKTYATPVVQIRSAEPMRIGWGNAVQPAIQDVARVVDTLSKASPDPSERIGFWDKIRLQLHWRVQLLCPGPNASVIFHVKGSRDPYALTGFGAGFAKAWKGDVQFRLGLDNPDHEFFQVLSDKYALGIPNLRDYVDAAATGIFTSDPVKGSGGAHSADGGSAYAASTVGGDEYDTASDVSADEDDISYWLKVCAKCINGVRWGMGIRLERTCRDEDCKKPTCHGLATFHRQCRQFEFIPHWHVHTKTPAAIGVHGEVADSFAGFRSDFVHFSISLTSPANLHLPREDETPPASPEDVKYSDDDGYNSFHFTPHAMTHFHRWWKLFDGCMSLPVRQGKLFPSAQAPSPKFGRHTATIKYRFSLAPLFISHTYRQETWAEWQRGETTVLGLKGKIGRFNVDLHQREQEMVIRRPEMSESKTVKHKAFYMAEIDLDALDLRTITAVFSEPIKADVAPADVDPEEDATPPPSYDDYVVAEEDLEWVNLNDFHDSTYTMPIEDEPRIRIMPFMVCPRFTYYRHKDSAPTKDADDASESEETPTPPERPKSKFGNEFSHTCLMGRATDTVMFADSTDAALSSEIELRIKAVQSVIERLRQIRDEAHLSTPSEQDPNVQANHEGSPPTPSTPATTVDEDSGDTSAYPHLTNTLYEEWGQWENRYMVHSPMVQVSNATREVLLKYYYSHSDRRGFVYHASASVLRFIRDLAKQHERKTKRDWSRRKSTRTGGSTSMKRSGPFQDSEQTNRLLDELAKRGGGMWATNEEQQTDERHHFGDHLDVDPYAAAAALPEAYDANSGHLCMFIKPQVSLQSDVDDKSTLVIAAFRAQVKVFEIIDTRVVDDPVNAEVLHQTFARLDGLQVFYPRQQVARVERGFAQAFVPLETLVDLRVEPWGFDRVVSRTSAAMRYDKFNQLRLSSKRGFADGGLGSSPTLESHFHTSTDRVSFEAEKFSLSANPAHFAAIYNVVTDLILYSDPLRKSRNSKVEALVFTRDFSNLNAVMETVGKLQQQIRGLSGAAQEFQVHLDELDDDGRVQLFLQRAEALRLTGELSLVVEAFTRAQDSNGAKTTSKRAGLQLESRAAELTWHMLDKSDLPFAKFSVIGAEYSWVSKQDGSASNRMVIKDLRALNSSPEQIFAEIIAKHETSDTDYQLAKMDVFAAALWNSLAPVGGISIVERFELHLHPVRLQLEHSVGRKILDYIFAERENKTDDDDDPTPRNGASKTASSLNLPGSNPLASRSVDSLAAPRKSYASSTSLGTGSDRPLTSSSASIRSVDHRLRKAVSSEMLVADVREEGLDADEMRRRAASNRTFIFVEVSSTLLCLTYRSEKEDKSSLPNIYNITYKTPLIQYRSKTWSFLDLLEGFKRDMIRSVWQQKTQLLGQLLSKTHRRLPMADARSAAKQAVQASVRKRMRFVKSRTQNFGSGGGSGSTSAPAPAPPLARRVHPLQGGLDRAGVNGFSESPSGSMRREASLSSDEEDDGEAEERTPPAEDGDGAGEHLPFDLDAAMLFHPDVTAPVGADVHAFHHAHAAEPGAPDLSGQSLGLGETAALVEEPESMDGVEEEGEDDGVKRVDEEGGRSRESTGSVGSASAAAQRSTSSFPTTTSRTGSTRPSPRPSQASSVTSAAPPRDGSFRSFSTSSHGSAGFPHHAPFRRPTGATMDEEEKRRMLLGKALD
ncbi:Protein SABRE [Rhodotorula kratochvilovae]